jgi:aminopeptidase N
LKWTFEYEGIISEWPAWSANVITEEWVELGLYLPWFPYNEAYGPFTFEIEVECDPKYRLRSYGSFKNANGKWHFKWMSPTTDIVLVANKNLKTIQQEFNGKRLNVHYSVIQDTTAKKLAGDLRGILELFEAWFGGYKESEITLIESLRERGGGYARTGLISLAGLSDDKYIAQHETYIRYLAHEASHMFWHMAPSDNWEDWMNEGFAEYSALMVIKELFGAESFNKRIETKKSNLAEKPPIWGFDRNDRATPEKSQAVEAILYSKGPVLLHLLEQRIGRDKFNAVCKEMVESNTSSTEDFLNLLLKNHGTALRDWFEDLLRSY